MKAKWVTLQIVCLLAGLAAWAAAVPSQEDLLKQADRLEQENRFADALKLYQYELSTFNQTDPHWTAYVTFRMACARYQLGDMAGAKESVDQAVELDSQEAS